MRTFRDAGITGDFVHQPLQHPKSDIRLIHVKPSDAENDEIECTISTHDLSKAPPFAAISYTWGDMASMRDIRVDGKHLSIGENSWLVLWQARLHKCPLPLWIDVLSINQTDSFEKGLQVSMMPSIYAAAKFICVGLGPQEDDSEFLAAEIRDHSYYIEHVRARSEHPWAESSACTACGASNTRQRYRCKQCVDSATYCVACKKTYILQAGHGFFLDVRTDFRHRGVCVRCEQCLSTRWYQPKDNSEGCLMKVCENCAEALRDATSDGSWDRGNALMNEWEHMLEPQGLDRSAQTGLKTSKRFFDKPLEDHLKIADAFRLLSNRPYFTRLWIIQEIVLSSSVIMVCGNDLYHFWELEAIMNDIRGVSEPDEYPQRTRELGMRGWPSFYFETIASHDMTYPETLWSAMGTFVSHSCSDPRDRVFGLLALADSECRDAFRPDYTKSATAVLLQLIEFHAETDKGDDSSMNFFWAHIIIGAFGLGPDEPDIASMRDRRRIAVHGQDPFSEITVATRDLQPLFIRENDPYSSRRLPRDHGSHHIVLDAISHCTVWKNDAGEFIVPLKMPNRAGNPSRRKISTGQENTAGGIKLRTPNGTVIGLANQQIQHGDTILLFESGVNEGIFHSALIVRRYGPTIATIVGQCIVDSDLKSCWGGSGCVFRGAMHISDSDTWQALMSPEDLLVFVAQDLKAVPRLPSYSGMPVMDVSVQPEMSIERVTTRVTSEEMSSYAIAGRNPRESPANDCNP